MKIKWTYALVLLLILTSCDEDDYPNSEIPSVVINSFRSSYPEAQAVEWNTHKDSYEAEFQIGKTEYTVALKGSGDAFKFKEEINKDSLPVPVLWKLGKAYGFERISDPEVIVQGEHRYYQVEIEKFLYDRELVVDRKGNIQDSLEYWD